MKKNISLLFFIFLCFFAFSQQNKNVSININDATLKEIILEIEKNSNYHFYFQESWLNQEIYSVNFSNVTITELLKDILKDTSLNFYILKDKIILTKNIAIYDKLSENYFENPSTQINEEKTPLEPQENISKTPVIQKEYTNITSNTNNIRPLIAIGKEDINNPNSKYVISGVIKNFNNGNPIDDVAIVVKNENINTITDSEGRFSLQLAVGKHILQTKLLGYETIEQPIVVYGKGTLNIDIPESITNLDEVLIESNRDVNIKEPIAGVTAIDVKGIKTIPLVLGERDVLKVATTMPGIKTAGEGSLGYNVRGGKSDQNLILLDDAVMYNTSHFFGFFSAINPFTTGNVKIYKGNFPAEYGGRLSSVIDINTSDPNMEKLSGEGSIGPITGNLTIETPIVKGKSAIIVGARATYSDWILKSLDNDELKNSEASFYDGIVSYNHKINEKNNLKTTLYYSKDRFSITSDSTYNYSNFLASLKWQTTFNNKTRGTAKLANSQYKFNIIYENPFNDDFDFGYTINETQFKYNLHHKLNKKHTLDFGVSTKYYGIKPGEIKPIADSNIEQRKIQDEQGLESALHISDLFDINDKLSIDLGFRYSLFMALGASSQNIYAANQPVNESNIIEVKTYAKNETIKTYGNPEIRFSARYLIDPSLSIKASFNSTAQYLHLISSNTTASPVDTWKLSDLNIKPQTANQISLGVFKNLKDDLYEISLEGYYKRMKNMADFKTGASLYLNENIETQLLQGKGKAYGIEFLMKKSRGKLNGWLGYSFSRTFLKLDSPFLTEKVNNGNYFPTNYDRPHDFNIVSNFKLTQRYSFSLNFNYQTGRPLTYPIGKFIYNGTEQVLYSDRNQERVPDYYRLDLGFNVEGNHKIKKLAHSFWNISVYNVLGRNNPYSVFFINNDGQVKGFQTSIFSIPVPTITYNFKF